MVNYYDMFTTTDDMFTVAVTEFDDSLEGDLKRQCKEADRTGVIPDCTWVRKYCLTVRTLLKLHFIQMTRDCRERWRAKCYHVRTGGLLTSPPPTTMIMPESNTTTIVITTSGTTLENQNDQSHSISSTEKMSSESINGSGQAISHLNFIKLNVFSGEDNLASNILSLLFLFVVYHQ